MDKSKLSRSMLAAVVVLLFVLIFLLLRMEANANESVFINVNDCDFIIEGITHTFYVDSIDNFEYQELLSKLYPNGIVDQQGQEIGIVQNSDVLREEFIDEHTNAFTVVNGKRSNVEIEKVFVEIEDRISGNYIYPFYQAFYQDDYLLFPSEIGNLPFGFTAIKGNYYIYSDLGIWQINPSSLKLEAITSDSSLSLKTKECYFWVDSVLFNESGTKVFYRSDRDANSNETSIWMVDLQTGIEEEIIPPGADNIINGFISDNMLLIGSTQNAKAYCIDTKQLLPIDIPCNQNSQIRMISKSYLVTSSYNVDSITTIEAFKIDEDDLSCKKLGEYSRYCTWPCEVTKNGLIIAIKVGEDPSIGADELLLWNIETDKKCLYTPFKKGDSHFNIVGFTRNNVLVIKDIDNSSVDNSVIKVTLSNSISREQTTRSGNYSIVFGAVPNPTVALQSPLPTYARVNSKWNQPRDSGSNPHKGIDLNATIGTYVYAPYDGWTEAISYAGAYDVKLVVDANNNGIKDDTYCIYFCHLSSREATGAVSQGDLIGLSGDEGGVPPHLHFGLHDSGQIWLRNEVSYRHLLSQTWNSGKDLDSYAVVEWNNNSAEFTSYIRDEGVLKQFDEVRIYYRTTPSGSWTDGGVLTSINNRYTYNFGNIFPSGTTVYWMFRLTRNVTSIKAFGPAKYYQPASNPNSDSHRYDYWTNTVW